MASDGDETQRDRSAAERSLLRGLVGFEALLYGAVALLLAAAAVLVLVGTVHELAHAISRRRARSTSA